MSAKLDVLLKPVGGVLSRIAPGSVTARRALPIRRPADELRRLWNDPQARSLVLAGLPTADASLEVDGEQGDWGTTATIRIRLITPAPLLARQTMAGKAVRRLKALAETGEVPTTDHNPSARSDAGEASPTGPGSVAPQAGSPVSLAREANSPPASSAGANPPPASSAGSAEVPA